MPAILFLLEGSHLEDQSQKSPGRVCSIYAYLLPERQHPHTMVLNASERSSSKCAFQPGNVSPELQILTYHCLNTSQS
jgi:hypothetical protein